MTDMPAFALLQAAQQKGRGPRPAPAGKLLGQCPGASECPEAPSVGHLC